MPLVDPPRVVAFSGEMLGSKADAVGTAEVIPIGAAPVAVIAGAADRMGGVSAGAVRAVITIGVAATAGGAVTKGAVVAPPTGGVAGAPAAAVKIGAETLRTG